MARIATAALLAVTLVWGATFVVVQDAVAELPVLSFLGWRFVIAAAVVAAWAALRGGRPDRATLRAGTGVGLLLWASFVLQTFALTATSASNVAFITGLAVVFTPLLARLRGASIAARSWALAVAGCVGLALLSGVGTSAARPLGDGLALLCAVAVAAHLLATAAAVRRVQLAWFVAIQLAVTAVLSLGAAAATGGVQAPAGASVWWALAVTALVASAVGLGVQSWAQRLIAPSRAALILIAEPVFAGATGYAVAGDRLSGPAWIGAALVLVAIAAAELAPRGRRPAPAG